MSIPLGGGSSGVWLMKTIMRTDWGDLDGAILQLVKCHARSIVLNHRYDRPDPAGPFKWQADCWSSLGAILN